MDQLPYQLASSVQDLFGLYQRVNPPGRFRNRLLNDPPAHTGGLPELPPEPARQADACLRGVSCLLANDLADAAFPLTAAAWRHVRAVARGAGAVGEREPEYYRYLSYELAHPRSESAAEAYRLFGEVLAVYLDVLCLATAEVDEALLAEVDRLRGGLSYSGMSPADASPGGSS